MLNYSTLKSNSTQFIAFPSNVTEVDWIEYVPEGANLGIELKVIAFVGPTWIGQLIFNLKPTLQLVFHKRFFFEYLL